MYKTIQRLVKKRYFSFIIVSMLLFALMGEMYHYFIVSNRKSMVISFNYPGAEEGLNPDGSRFNISELTSDEILDSAKSGLKMEKQSNDSIRSHMQITTNFLQAEMDDVVSSIKNDSQSSYVPTSFYLKYTQKNKLRKNESYEFLESLAESYENYFNENHAENNSVLVFDENSYDFSDYEYTEIYEILYNKADRIINLIDTHRGENRAFRSDDDNLNFGTLRDELINFRDVTLEKFNAYVVQNNISKSRTMFMGKLDYLMDKKGIIYRKKRQASDIAKFALEEYDPKIAAVAFIPSVDTLMNFYMSRTKTGIDDIAMDSYEDGMDASRVSKDIDSYNHIYQKLSNAKDSSWEQIYYTDTFLTNIVNEFSALSKKAVKLDAEYLEYKTEDYLTYQITEKSKIVNLTIILKFMLLGFFLALIMVVYIEFLYSFIRKKTTIIKRALLMMTKYRK